MKYWLIIKPLKAILYSISGIKTAIATERAFQQELIVLIILLIMVPYSGVDFVMGSLMILSWVVVMVIELLNSAIEAAFDRIGTEENALTQIGKDLGSAAVFLSILYNIGLWIATGIYYSNMR